jgi:hypothetical protein
MAQFTLSENVNSQNNGYWCSENPHAVHDLPLHDLKARVWREMCLCKTTGPMFFRETVNTYHYVQLKNGV